MTVSADIKYVGVNDHEIDLFEGQYVVPNGMAYNSYVIVDEKIVVMDTVDKHFTQEWLGNVAKVLGNRKPDYLVVQHMECDHSGSIMAFLNTYPDVTIVASAKAFTMLHNFHEEKEIPEEKKLEIKEGDTLNLGKHELAFVAAPMVTKSCSRRTASASSVPTTLRKTGHVKPDGTTSVSSASTASRSRTFSRRPPVSRSRPSARCTAPS